MSAAAFWAKTHHSKTDLTPTEIDLLWGNVPGTQKKRFIAEHKKKLDDYFIEFENFVRVNSITFILKSFFTFFLSEFCI